MAQHQLAYKQHLTGILGIPAVLALCHLGRRRYYKAVASGACITLLVEVAEQCEGPG